MIFGSYSIPRVTEESVCRSSKDYRFADVGVYKVHSNVLLSSIPFEEAEVTTKNIDTTIFVNDNETKPDMNMTIKCQNFISAKYIGRAPLEWYGNDDDTRETKMGRQFVLICRNGNTSMEYRIFGTEDAIRGYNRNANENVMMPGGGD